ncbi:MAG: HEAT repeat domain-containing protein [Armatimonadota bacterium]
MDENTRRQITWIFVMAAVLSLVILTGGRRGELARLRFELAVAPPAHRIETVQRLVETQKLAEAVTGQPRWVQDNVVSAIGFIGTEKALFQLMTCWTVVDAPVQPRILATVSRFGPLAIPPLVEALTDKDAKVRAGAPGVLTAIGAPTIPYLLPLMGAWDDYVRVGVATVFGGVGKPVCPDLVKIVQRSEPLPNQDAAEFNREKDCAVTSLLNMKVNALDALTGELLVSEDPEVRGQAATMLGTIGAGLKPEEAPQVIPPLVKTTNDGNWAVRRKAAAALGALGQFALIGDVAPVLMQKLSDPRKEVRAAAADALGKIESPTIRETAAKTVETLAAAAAAAGAPGAPPAAPAAAPDPKLYRLGEAKQVAAKMGGMLIANQSGASRELSVALVRMGAVSIAPLQSALNSGDGAVRLLATQTIAEIGGPDSIGYLARALRDPSSGDVREVASDALRNAAPESLQRSAGTVISSLAAALTDPDWQVYYAARDALAKIGGPAVPSLVAALSNPDTRVGHMAEMALTRIGAPAVPGLVKALKSGSGQVVNWASISLGEIGDPSIEPLKSVIADGSVSAPARAAAARALGDTGLITALGPLKAAAKASEPVVRAAALRGLVNLGDAGGTENLVTGLTDPAPAVRDVAMGLLKNWRQDPVQDLLKKTLAGSDTDAKYRAAIALVFQDASVTNQLLRQVATETTEQATKQAESVEGPLVEAALSTSSATNVRTDAITALGYIGSKNTIAKLKDLLQPSNPMALPAAQAVAMIGVRQAATLADQVEDRLGEAGNMLIGLANEQKTNPELGLAAAVALSNMEEIPVDKLIAQLVTTSDEANRGWSAAILAAIGKPATEKVLRTRGSSKDIVQRQWLASTLQVIGDAMALQLMKHLPDEEKPQAAQVLDIQTKVERIRGADAL